MKQIFDWLREQMNELLKPDIECFDCEEDFEFELKRHNKYLGLVNEAEAKWEADCCEWKPIDDDFLEYRSNCDRISAVNSYWKACPFCRKPIKISEVE